MIALTIQREHQAFSSAHMGGALTSVLSQDRKAHQAAIGRIRGVHRSQCTLSRRRVVIPGSPACPAGRNGRTAGQIPASSSGRCSPAPAGPAGGYFGASGFLPDRPRRLPGEGPRSLVDDVAEVIGIGVAIERAGAVLFAFPAEAEPPSCGGSLVRRSAVRRAERMYRLPRRPLAAQQFPAQPAPGTRTRPDKPGQSL